MARSTDPRSSFRVLGAGPSAGRLRHPPPWESVLIRDGEAIAHLQENISAGPVSFGSGAAAAAPLELDDDGDTTLLAALTSRFGAVHLSVMQSLQS